VEVGGRAGTPSLKDRFLIDECLSGDLVATAKARGHEADYVPHIGKGGWQGWNRTVRLRAFRLTTKHQLALQWFNK
jgi:hypothetical protein